MDYTQETGVFFDLDDTLYDHLTPLRDTLQHILGLGHDFPYDQAYQRFRYYSDMLSAQQTNPFAANNKDAQVYIRTKRYVLMLQEFDIEITLEQGHLLQEDYMGRQYDISLFEGAEDVIRQLQQQGRMVGILTNGAEEHQRKKIQALALDKLIPAEQIFITGAVGWDKPNVRIFEHINQQTHVLAKNSYYVGDSWRNDVIGALGAGWHVLWFNHRQAEPESHHTPQYVVRQYEEIARILLTPKS
ncbi:HAD family hydrolase [Paenibacillus selenitireducens]|uniref:HAD family hydrolase n=1 Tax=Paenibacillus selenitireducens TaxID=1324314 RepID=A0A1T2X5U7_9BACL|nr:HAD family hydrolase [Paenibacillus selenitireducens]OPA75264.1 HAD family hydrolase [Paenibacillus selenitireducens]